MPRRCCFVSRKCPMWESQRSSVDCDKRILPGHKSRPQTFVPKNVAHCLKMGYCVTHTICLWFSYASYFLGSLQIWCLAEDPWYFSVDRLRAIIFPWLPQLSQVEEDLVSLSLGSRSLQPETRKLIAGGYIFLDWFVSRLGMRAKRDPGDSEK